MITEETSVVHAKIDRICAVVVTFNRKAHLTRCLLALENQTRRLDAILVVDNRSTDGTDVTLAEQFPHLASLRLETNSGGAGGFHEGMKWAYERGFDWLWVMDDDIEVTVDALESLLEFRALSDFINPSRLTDRGQPFPWEGVFDPTSLSKKRFPTDVSFEAGRVWIPVNYGCFEGALIHRRVVQQIGFPDKRFFIQGDDEIYGYHASRWTNVIYVNEPCVKRQLPSPSDLTENRCYLTFRNRFLTYEHLAASKIPMSRIALWLQNLLLVTWCIRTTKPRSLHNYWRNLRGMVNGMWDGARGRYGPPPWVH